MKNNKEETENIFNENSNKSMGFLESCIKKPIIPVVISIFILLIGSFSLLKLQIRNTPKVERGIFVIDVYTVNPIGAEEVDAQITEKIAKLLPSVPNLDYFQCTSKSSHSQCVVHFKPGVSESNALNDLRSVMSRVYLGSIAKSPTIYSRSEDDAMLTIYFYPNEENKMDENLYFDNFYNFLETVFIPAVKKVQGVGSVENYGHSKPQFSIELDFLKLAQLGIRPHEISHIINREAKVVTYGDVKTGTKSFSFNSKNSIIDIKTLGNILIDSRRGIRIKDIAKVYIKYPETSKFRLFQGRTKTIGVSIYKTGEGNPLFINKEINLLLNELIDHKTKYVVRNSFENSEIIFNKTKRTFLEAVILLFIILILFLGGVRILLLPLIAIPLSIMGTFLFMWYFKLSINEITLMAFLLALGLLVDDAILIIENIERRRKKEHKLDENVIFRATLEIYQGVIVMTATLFCVFLPVVFLPGEMGYTLREFALTISISVGWSGVFSLILTPMMCKYFMKNYEPYSWTEKWLHWLEGVYRKVLEKLINYKKRILISLSIFNFSGLSTVFFMKNEYYPQTKTDYFYFYTNGLKNLKADYLKQKESEKIREILEKYNDKMLYFNFEISNGEIDVSGRFLEGNKDLYLRKIKEELKEKIPYISFLSYSSGDENLYFDLIFSSYDESILDNTAYYFMEELEKEGSLQNYSFIQTSSYSYTLEVDKERCLSKKINVEEVQHYLDFLFQSHQMQEGKILGEDNKKYKIVINSAKIGDNMKLLQSYSWKVSNRYGSSQILTLYDLVKLKPTLNKSSVETYNGLPSKYVRVSCKKDITAGEIYKQIKSLQKRKLGKDIYLNYTKELKTYEQNSGQIIYVFFACLLSIFLILAVQFNSFLQSILIMSTVPLAFTGAAVSLYFYGTINIFSTIGAITLVALITKHGILFMSKEGDPIDIGVERLRPLLMTTIAMILGNIPLLLYREEAMAPLKQMAIVIVPGLIYGTIMVLIFFPLILSFIERKKDNDKLPS